MTIAATPLPLSPATQAQWNFTEGSGTVSTDTLGVNVAMLQGTPTWSSDTPTGGGGSILLNGSTQWIETPTVLARGQTALTVAFWFKAKTAYPGASDVRLFWYTPNYSSEVDLDFYIQSTGNGSKLKLRWYAGGVTTTVTSASNVSFATTDWHRMAFRINAYGNAAIFMDGVKLGETNALPLTVIYSLAASGSNPTFGAFNQNGSQSTFINGLFHGIVYEWRSWNDAEFAADFATSTRYPSLASKLLGDLSMQAGFGNGGAAGNSFAAAAGELTQVLLPDGQVFSEMSLGWSAESIFGVVHSNPLSIPKQPYVLGNGYGGEAGVTTGRGRLLLNGSNLILFYSPTINNGDWKAVVSADFGNTFGNPQQVIAKASIGDGTGAATGCPVLCPDGTWRLAIEAGKAGGWAIYGFSSTNPLTGWTALNGGSALSTLQIGTGVYGGPTVRYVNGLYHMLYHATATSTLPSAVFWATSSDFITWTVQNNGLPVIDIPSTGGTLWDQTANPSILEMPQSVIVTHCFLQNSLDFSGLRGVQYVGTLSQLFTEGSYPSPQVAGVLTPSKIRIRGRG